MSVPKAIQLIPKAFNENPQELREFIQKVALLHTKTLQKLKHIIRMHVVS
jgi:hypothetical protein